MAVPKKQDTTSHNLGLFKTESGQENVISYADFRREYTLLAGSHKRQEGDITQSDRVPLLLRRDSNASDYP